MNTLILDCSAGMSVYVCKDNAVFSHTDLNVKKHTDERLVTLDKLLIQAGVGCGKSYGYLIPVFNTFAKSFKHYWYRDYWYHHST